MSKISIERLPGGGRAIVRARMSWLRLLIGALALCAGWAAFTYPISADARMTGWSLLLRTLIWLAIAFPFLRDAAFGFFGHEVVEFSNGTLTYGRRMGWYETTRRFDGVTNLEAVDPQEGGWFKRNSSPSPAGTGLGAIAIEQGATVHRICRELSQREAREIVSAFQQEAVSATSRS